MKKSSDSSATCSPPLTTVDQAIETMGRLAAQIMLTLMRDQLWETQLNKVPTKLVIRQSCRATGL